MGPGVQPYESWVDCVCAHSFVSGAATAADAVGALVSVVPVSSVAGSVVVVASDPAVVAILACVRTRRTNSLEVHILMVLPPDVISVPM